jgi:hypothetical protein
MDEKVHSSNVKIQNPNINVEILKPSITGNSGNGLRNFVLDLISKEVLDSDWVYFLDDDNIIHPQFQNILKRVIDKKEFDLLVFAQQLKGGTKRLSAPLNFEVGNVDTAMYALRFGPFRDLRWHPTDYCADGIYAQDLETRNPRKLITQDFGSYYNYLR